MSSRQRIRAAARDLFAEHGYDRTTVREVAEAAAVSPALVVKHFGSKAELYAEVGPARLTTPLAELGLPRSAMGRAIVLQLVKRRDEGVTEPWAALGLAVRQSPAPSVTLAQLRDQRLEQLAGLIGDRTDDLRYAQTLMCLLMGTADGLRELDLFAVPPMERDQVVRVLTVPLQAVIDACAAQSAG